MDTRILKGDNVPTLKNPSFINRNLLKKSHAVVVAWLFVLGFCNFPLPPHSDRRRKTVAFCGGFATYYPINKLTISLFYLLTRLTRPVAYYDTHVTFDNTYELYYILHCPFYMKAFPYIFV